LEKDNFMLRKIFSFVLRYIPRPYIQYVAHYIAKCISIFYLGKKVECPVCNSKFRKFLPYGRGKASRDNALCPSCLSLERHRMIWYFLKTKTNFFTDKNKVLHIAPEYSFIKRFKNLKNIDYTTGDIESPLADMKIDVLDIPFGNEIFDIVFCNHVLEHIEDDNKAMKEIFRILKKGGIAILQVPIKINNLETYEDFTITDPKERERLFEQNDHVRLYGMDYVKRLENVGFTVSIINYDKETNDISQKYVFDKNEPLFYIVK